MNIRSALLHRSSRTIPEVSRLLSVQTVLIRARTVAGKSGTRQHAATEAPIQAADGAAHREHDYHRQRAEIRGPAERVVRPQ